MDALRRTLLKGAGASGALFAAIAAGLLKPGQVLAASWNKSAFDAKTLADAVKTLGYAGATENKDIQIKAPDIAENGAVVPIDITSNIPGTQTISVLIEKNPFPLAASFDFSNGALPYVALRAKIGESSNIRVVVAAAGKFYMTSKEVKVTIGGCGG